MNSNYGNGNIHCMDTPGLRLKALRKKKGFSQVQLAKLIKVDQSTVSDIENGGGLSAEYMMRLCEALGATPQYVMRGVSDADELLSQIKQLVTSGSAKPPAQVETLPPKVAAQAQDDSAITRRSKVSLASSQPEPKTPKGANLGTDGGKAKAKPRGTHASNQVDRVRKQGNN